MQEVLLSVQGMLEGLGLFRYIDLDWGQGDFFSEVPVSFPAALIAMASAEDAMYEGGGQLRFPALISVRIVDVIIPNSNLKAPERQRRAATNIYEIADKCIEALHGAKIETRRMPNPISFLRQSVRLTADKRTEITLEFHTNILYKSV